MTAQPLSPAACAEVARRVERLTLGLFDAARIARILSGETYSDYANLIREIAAEVAREKDAK